MNDDANLTAARRSVGQVAEILEAGGSRERGTADAIARGMRKIVASVALCCTLNVVTSCVLPPPAHKVALAIDGAAIAVGAGIMLTAGEMSAEDSGLSTESVGEIVLLTGVATAALTLLIYAFDRPLTTEAHKKQAAKASGEWLRPTPVSESEGGDGSESGDGSEGPAAAADSYEARDAMLHPFKR